MAKLLSSIFFSRSRIFPPLSATVFLPGVWRSVNIPNSSPIVNSFFRFSFIYFYYVFAYPYPVSFPLFSPQDVSVFFLPLTFVTINARAGTGNAKIKLPQGTHADETFSTEKSSGNRVSPPKNATITATGAAQCSHRGPKSYLRIRTTFQITVQVALKKPLTLNYSGSVAFR